MKLELSNNKCSKILYSELIDYTNSELLMDIIYYIIPESMLLSAEINDNIDANICSLIPIFKLDYSKIKDKCIIIDLFTLINNKSFYLEIYKFLKKYNKLIKDLILNDIVVLSEDNNLLSIKILSALLNNLPE